jgi:hypothetical protein
MTGRGEGYCALVFPLAGEEGTPYGYTGVQGTPVRLGTPAFGPYSAYGSYPSALGLGRPRWGMGRGYWGRGAFGLGFRGRGRRGRGRGRW